MTTEELIKNLKQLKDKCINKTYGVYDAEQGHREADKLLLAFINDEAVSEAFEELEKWYS